MCCLISRLNRKNLENLLRVAAVASEVLVVLNVAGGSVALVIQRRNERWEYSCPHFHLKSFSSQVNNHAYAVLQH